MADTPVCTNLLQSFQILSEFVIKCIGKELRIFSIDDILLSVEKPFRDLVLRRVLKNCDDTLELFGCKFAGSRYQTTAGRRGYRLLRSTSAFLITTLEYRRPTPLILVKANMILSFPSTLVLRRRRMCWKAFLSGTTSAMVKDDVDNLQ